MKNNARKTDPKTSHEAGNAAHVNGFAKMHAKIILEQIKLNPRMTSGELQDVCGLTSVQITRRINDLRRRGLVKSGEPRICTVKKTKMQTHWSTSKH